MCKKRSDVQRGKIAGGDGAGNQLPMNIRLFLSEALKMPPRSLGTEVGKPRNKVCGSEDLAPCFLTCRRVAWGMGGPQ